METSLIGVDLGGTNMRAGIVEGPRIKKTESRPVPSTDNWKEVFNELTATIEAVWKKEIQGIGIGVPGIVDKMGVVYDIQNIPSWVEVPLGKMLSDRFDVPVYVNNDANCFAAGERFYGKGRNYDDFIGLISGTGLGAGIIKDGRLMSDQNCGAGEFGMIPYLDQNYEHYCSGQFFSSHGLSGFEAAIKAEKGDAQALELFDSYGKHLGNAIKTIIFAVDPAAIILGGSVSKSFNLFGDALMKELKTFPYKRTIQNLQIMVSGMPEIAIAGAAALYFENAEAKKQSIICPRSDKLPS
ncbi:MAG: ROK family protein [Marinilabilia sp.]